MHEGCGFQHCHITDFKTVLALYGSTSNGFCTANLFAFISVQNT